MLQNYGTATLGSQTLRFGARVRSYRDANYSETGINGSYFFTCASASQCNSSYQAATPAQYTATVINNPVARALMFDGSLFVQDDWRRKRHFCSVWASATRARTISMIMPTGPRAWRSRGHRAVPAKLLQKL